MSRRYRSAAGYPAAVSATGAGRLVLVRHAMPELDPAVPSTWRRLGEAGRAAARALRPLLPGSAYHVASDEPKAVQTLRELAGHHDVATDPGFAEVHHRYVWAADHGYRALAYAYLEGVCHEGWEPHALVAARFDAAVVRHAAAAGDRMLVVGTHGLAPTVWLASRMRVEPSPARFWAALRWPELIDVALTAGTASRRGT